jgi:hypothetical protein
MQRNKDAVLDVSILLRFYKKYFWKWSIQIVYLLIFVMEKKFPGQCFVANFKNIEIIDYSQNTLTISR